MKTQQDKGHQQQFKKLVESVAQAGEAMIPFDEIVNTTLNKTFIV